MDRDRLKTKKNALGVQVKVKCHYGTYTHEDFIVIWIKKEARKLYCYVVYSCTDMLNFKESVL